MDTVVSREDPPCPVADGSTVQARTGSISGRKRKDRDNGNGQATQKKRKADSQSGSCFTDRLLGSRKRKPASDGEGEGKKRKRGSKEPTESCEASGGHAGLCFVSKYEEVVQLGKIRFGTVLSGYRREDGLPVGIKYVKKKCLLPPLSPHGKKLPAEVAIMLKLASEKDDSVGMSTPIELLDWYDLGSKLVLVLERPIHAVDLHAYTVHSGGTLNEWEAQAIMKQLVDAAVELEKREIFHSDMKLHNILIDLARSVPRARITNFGLSSIVNNNKVMTEFHGTRKHVSPEVYYNLGHRAGPITVWQLGIILFEMLHKKVFTTRSFLNEKLKISTELPKDCKNFLKLCLKLSESERATLTKLQGHVWLKTCLPDPALIMAREEP